jgi:large subunit ribosomal protein L24
MDAALASGVLAVPLAEGAITIEGGQARLSGTTVRAQRADVAVSGGVNLAEGALDARLTLSGAGGPGAPASTRPEVFVALKGPLDAPKRTVDVAALASWLALRAVEQQSKKLDVLEGREPAVTPTRAVTPRPAINANTQPAPAAQPAAPEAAPGEPGASPPTVHTQPASAPKPKPAAPAAEQRAPPLPPPIDIRPAPQPPRPQPGVQGAPSQPQPQKPAAAATPARPRSLSEILFGR